MEKLFEKINKIEDTNELNEIWAEVFNLENRLTDNDLGLQFDCFRIKSVVSARIDFIVSNHGQLGIS